MPGSREGCRRVTPIAAIKARSEDDGSSYLTGDEYTAQDNLLEARTPEEPGENAIMYRIHEHGEILVKTRIRIEQIRVTGPA